jgi:AcrR family transcriptional regulator
MTSTDPAPPTAPGPPTAPDDAGAPELSRRERKKRATRQAIESNALRLFTERGYDATTVQDITEAADVAPRTFFLHFASKEDVLLGDWRRDVAAFGAALQARPAEESVLDSVRETVRSQLLDPAVPEEEHRLRTRLLIDNPALLGRIFEHYAAIEDTISRNIARRAGLDPDTDGYPAFVSACAISAVRVGSTVWYRRGGSERLVDVVMGLFDTLATGLRPPPPPD